MSGQQDDDSDKTHEASEQKLRKAREKGDLVRSADITTASAYAGFWLGLSAFGGVWIERVGTGLTGLLSNADGLSATLLQSEARAAIPAIAGPVVQATFTLFGFAAVFVVLALFAQRAMVFAPDKIKPKLSHFSILKNAKQKYGPNGLFEFAKSFVKLIAIGACLSIFLRANLPILIESARLEPTQSLTLLTDLMLKMLTLIVLIAAAIAVFDYSWQKFDFMRRNKMSHKELMDEIKDAEGDPTMKAKRRGKAQEIAMNKMMADVPKADVIIVNPTHYAVALAWDRTPGSAPKCLAKGVDEIAFRIREIAKDSGIPIHEDPPTARALHAQLEIGQEIPFEHFAAVAIAVRFAQRMREKAKRRG